MQFRMDYLNTNNYHLEIEWKKYTARHPTTRFTMVNLHTKIIAIIKIFNVMGNGMTWCIHSHSRSHKMQGTRCKAQHTESISAERQSQHQSQHRHRHRRMPTQTNQTNQTNRASVNAICFFIFFIMVVCQHFILLNHLIQQPRPVDHPTDQIKRFTMWDQHHSCALHFRHCPSTWQTEGDTNRMRQRCRDYPQNNH